MLMLTLINSQSFDFQPKARKITITVPNDNFDPTDYIGEMLTLVFWHEPEDSHERSRGVRFEGYAGTQDYYHHDLHNNHTVVRVPSSHDRQGAVVVYDIICEGQ